MDYECGTCGARRVRVFADGDSDGFWMECENGHLVAPVPGSEFLPGPRPTAPPRWTPVEE